MKTAVRRILLLSALMSPGALYALGLGEIHLNSALNQPFDADIELVSATDEDLGALRAALASNESFAKYGLDRPAYLSDFTFRVAKGADGQDVLNVTSPRPVTEPFVTMLVEASWPRGRLLREYTVLLDPPVFAPTPAAAEAPVAAPRAAVGARAVRTRRATCARGCERLHRNRPEQRRRRAPPCRRTRASSRARRTACSPTTRSGGLPARPTRARARTSIAPWSRSSRTTRARSTATSTCCDPAACCGFRTRARSSAISACEASAEVARQYQMWRKAAAPPRRRRERRSPASRHAGAGQRGPVDQHARRRPRTAGRRRGRGRSQGPRAVSSKPNSPRPRRLLEVQERRTRDAAGPAGTRHGACAWCRRAARRRAGAGHRGPRATRHDGDCPGRGAGGRAGQGRAGEARKAAEEEAADARPAGRPVAVRAHRRVLVGAARPAGRSSAACCCSSACAAKEARPKPTRGSA